MRIKCHGSRGWYKKKLKSTRLRYYFIVISIYGKVVVTLRNIVDYYNITYSISIFSGILVFLLVFCCLFIPSYKSSHTANITIAFSSSQFHRYFSTFLLVCRFYYIVRVVSSLVISNSFVPTIPHGRVLSIPHGT